MSLSKEQRKEQRYDVKFCVGQGKKFTETYHELKKQHGDLCMGRTSVYRWYHDFKTGRIDATDMARPGRPVDVATPAMISQVKVIVDEDRRLTIREIAETAQISYGTVFKILHYHLNMTRVCSRWVPRLLTEDQKKARVQASEAFLARYRREGQKFLQRIITYDESNIPLYTPERKIHSMVWKTHSEPSPVKATSSPSKQKIMFYVFDLKGVVLSHMVPSGQTVNGSYHSQVRGLYVDFILIFLIYFETFVILCIKDLI